MIRALAFVIGLLPIVAVAQSSEKDQALCSQIEKGINALVDYTQTACSPAAGQAPTRHSFILISSKPVFSVESSKKGWLLVAVAATGNVLNNNSSLGTDELWLSDADQMKKRIAYVISAEKAKSLQKQVKADKISLEKMYSEITANLTEKQIPPAVFASVEAKASETKAEADREWRAVQTCQFAIMASLHDPQNAEFPAVSRSYRKLANGVYTTQVEVRGKNAFNATRLVVFECKIDAKTMKLKSIKQLRS